MADPVNGSFPPKSGLAKTSLGISLFAGMALLSGFAVDATLALLFGAGLATDAFFVAATVPFSIGSLLLASTNQSLVPLFTSWFGSEETKEAERRTGAMLGTMIAVASGVALLGIVSSPVLPTILAPGSPAQVHREAIPLSALLFATLAFRAGSEVLRSLLNARFSFYLPAASPIVQSIVVIAVAFLGAEELGVVAFGLGYLAGSALQFVWLMLAARRRGIGVRLRWDLNDPAIRHGFGLMAWPVGSSGLNLVTRWVERLIASFLPVGSISLISYAWRIVNGIGGTVFFRSVTVAILPQLGAANDDANETRRLLRTGMLIMAAIAIPLTAGVIALALPSVRLLFLRGEFSTQDAAVLASLLAIFAISFPFSSFLRVLLSYFFARLDMRPPFVNRVLMTITNIVLAVPLAAVFGIHGLAWAYVLASVVSLVDARKKTSASIRLPERELLIFAARVALASIGAAVATWFVLLFIDSGQSVITRLFELAAGSLVFLLALAILGLALRLKWALQLLWTRVIRQGR